MSALCCLIMAADRTGRKIRAIMAHKRSRNAKKRGRHTIAGKTTTRILGAKEQKSEKRQEQVRKERELRQLRQSLEGGFTLGRMAAQGIFLVGHCTP